MHVAAIARWSHSLQALSAEIVWLCQAIRKFARSSLCDFAWLSMASAASINLANRTFVITGGNSGIGLETARALVHKNAHVVIASKTRERGDAAVKELQREASSDAKVDCMQVDLASFR